jgi:diacylglycerol kinase (ATP)
MLNRIIANPNAGSFAAAENAIRAAANDAQCELCLTQEPGDAARLAREARDRGYSRVIAGGGDGTLHEVVQGVGANADIGVGLLPLGTGNDFARAMGIPLHEYPAALEIALHAPLAAVDLIRCVTSSSDNLIVNAAAGGLNEAIHDDVDADTKKKWGPVAYLVSAAKQVIDPPVFAAKLRVGERTFVGDTHAIAIINTGRIGGGIPISPSASPSDGRFEVFVVPRQSTTELIAGGIELMLGAHENSPGVIRFTAARLIVEVEPAMRFHLDGEGVQARRFEFSIVPHALRFAVPAAPGCA